MTCFDGSGQLLIAAGNHHVLVGVHYGLNFAGILACQGLYQETRALSFTPGEKAIDLLGWEGRIVGMGLSRRKIPSIPTNPLLLQNMSATGAYQVDEDDFPIFSSIISSIPQYCQEENIHLHVGALFKLEEVNEAFNHMLQHKSQERSSSSSSQ
ncbi:LOW QUALITY PROTEIN: quinone oxidoreductase-like protein 2 [Phoenicopterus ruber ruber]